MPTFHVPDADALEEAPPPDGCPPAVVTALRVCWRAVALYLPAHDREHLRAALVRVAHKAAGGAS